VEKLKKKNKVAAVEFTVSKFSDLNKIIIPFFKALPIQSSKQFDYIDCCKFANLMNERKI
jgi:hypothetical protein